MYTLEFSQMFASAHKLWFVQNSTAVVPCKWNLHKHWIDTKTGTLAFCQMLNWFKDTWSAQAYKIETVMAYTLNYWLQYCLHLPVVSWLRLLDLLIVWIQSWTHSDKISSWSLTLFLFQMQKNWNSSEISVLKSSCN